MCCLTVTNYGVKSGRDYRIKAPRFGASSRHAPSATLAVDAKAKALKAAGEPIIGFGPGEPNFPTPENVVEAAAPPVKTRATTSTPLPPVCLS